MRIPRYNPLILRDNGVQNRDAVLSLPFEHIRNTNQCRGNAEGRAFLALCEIAELTTLYVLEKRGTLPRRNAHPQKR